MPVYHAEIITTKQLYQKTYLQGNLPDDYKDKVAYWKEYFIAMNRDGSFKKVYTHEDWREIYTKKELLEIIDVYPPSVWNHFNQNEQ